jgi:hypothetical protein
MLSNFQIMNLAEKMNMPIERICFKNALSEEPLKYNIGYIINSQDDKDEETGKDNVGSHWTALYVAKTKDGRVEPLYFDSYGIAPAEDIKKFVAPHYLPYLTKDVQSLMADCCGFYALAFIYFVSVSHFRSGNLYQDGETFIDLFDDLNKSTDWKKNEWILSQFFQAKDPKLRKEIDVFGEGKLLEEQNENVERIPILSAMRY